MVFAEQLIAIIKEYPILYDTAHPEYRNAIQKEEAWHEISVALNVNSADVKKKWKNLKDTYLKYLKSINTKPGQLPRYYGKWQWAPMMCYFKPYMGFPKMDSTHSVDINFTSDNSQNQFNEDNSLEVDETVDTKDNIFIQDLDPLHLTPTITQSSNDNGEQCKRDLDNKGIKRKLSLDNTVSSYVSNKRKLDTMDAIELIFLGYAKTIKSFSLKRQAIIKMKIATIIMEQELQHLEETSSS